jgi:hypothetical protein
VCLHVEACASVCVCVCLFVCVCARACVTLCVLESEKGGDLGLVLIFSFLFCR